MPMHYFTSEKIRPSKKTLDMIKQIAYSYRVVDTPQKEKIILFLN